MSGKKEPTVLIHCGNASMANTSEKNASGIARPSPTAVTALLQQHRGQEQATGGQRRRAQNQ
jgi:hypothetical protein